MPFHPSKIILDCATRWPLLGRFLTRFWFTFQSVGKPPHWLLQTLKNRLGMHFSRRVNIDGFDVVCDPFDGLTRLLIQQGFTEPETRLLFADEIRPGMTIFDVGAYIGQFTLVASRQLAGTGRVVAFEPSSAAFALLSENVRRNHLSNVRCIHAAVSDSTGEATFYLMPASADQNSLRPLAGSDAIPVKVALETIDHVAESLSLDRIDLIKIDVEGNELFALRGARSVLREFRPLLIIEISHHQFTYGYSGSEIQSFLEELGYQTMRIDENEGLVPYQPSPSEINDVITHFNIVAMHSTQHGQQAQLITESRVISR